MKRRDDQAKKSRSSAQYFINGAPASLAEIAESSGDKEVWRSYLERDRDPSSQHRYLEKYLGKYVTAGEIHWPPGMRDAALRKWKNSGKVRAEHVRGRWYYSLRDLLTAIREE